MLWLSFAGVVLNPRLFSTPGFPSSGKKFLSERELIGLFQKGPNRQTSVFAVWATA